MQWYFGRKTHLGVDVSSGLVHTLRVTSGHVSIAFVEADALIDQAEKIGKQ
jgi:IS5 family transposase